MRDMTRDEMQDLLPDLLHGRLAPAEATALEQAVATDPALASELALLRSVMASHESAPRVDVTRIVAALPTPPAQALAAAPAVDDLAVRRAARTPLVSRAFARAAALLVVVGGGTMVSVWNGGRAPVTAAQSPVTSESIAAVGAGTMQLGLGTSTDELSVEQLRALEADIRSLDGMPSSDVDAAGDVFTAGGA